jgi:hypothetical protein
MSMHDIHLLLIILHVVGVVLGVGAATFIEVFLNKSLADKKMDEVERGFMKTTFVVLRVGLVLSAVTGIGFIGYYAAQGNLERLLNNDVFWAKNVIILILVVNAVLLHLHIMKLRWGSAFSFVSWWAAFLLGIFLTQSARFSFIEIMVTYALSVAVGAFVLEYIRTFVQERAARKIAPAQTASIQQ